MGLAFKEWSLICDALGSGRQILILRKGGIAEGRAKFSFKTDQFFLFPTHFHEQISKLTLPADTPLPASESGIVRIGLHAEATHSFVLNSWKAVESIEPFHIWKPDVIRQRFEYDGRNEIHLALVRVSKVDPIWTLQDSPAFGGCKSWIEVGAPPERHSLIPVLQEHAYEARAQEILSALAAHAA